MNSIVEHKNYGGNNIGRDIRELLGPLENSSKVLNEAEFGYRQVKEHIRNCSPGARILEIGSGPCILLAQLKTDFPEMDFTGVEPLGSEFANFENALQRLKVHVGFNLVRSGYEDFSDPGKFDLIFLVNVFEHLPDWKHFLGFVSEKLNSGGACLILCPNYGFPYESHFSLPVLFGKRFTYKIFRKKIERHETEHDCHGLWETLNFVKWSKVKRYLETQCLQVEFEKRMLRQMIERLDYDPEFAERQKTVAFVSRLALKTGILRLFEFPLFYPVHPYMSLKVTIG